MRKRRAVKRDVLPDPVYKSKVVTKLINRIMVDGKKGKAETILYEAFDIIKERTKEDPVVVFEKALENIKPQLEVKSRRVGGSNYQVPVEVSETRSQTLGLRWLVNYARLRGGNGIIACRIVSLEIPGIILCAAFSSVEILNSRYLSMYPISAMNEWIDIIWRAI